MNQETYDSLPRSTRTLDLRARGHFPTYCGLSEEFGHGPRPLFICFCCKEEAMNVRWLHLPQVANRVAIKPHSASKLWTGAGLRLHIKDFHIGTAGKYSILSGGIIRSFTTPSLYEQVLSCGLDKLADWIGPGNYEPLAMIWLEVFITLYPEFTPAKHLLSPVEPFDPLLTDDTLKRLYKSRVDFTLLSANLLHPGLRDPSLRFEGFSQHPYDPYYHLYRIGNTQPVLKSEPEEELKYYSTETQPAGQPLLIGPRDSVEPRYQTRDGYSDEVKHVDRMRLTDEIHYPIQQRGTDELVESAPVRFASDELVVKSSPRMESRVYEVPAHQQSPGVRPGPWNEEDTRYWQNLDRDGYRPYSIINPWS